MAVRQQAYAFAVMAACGGIAALVYDLLLAAGYLLGNGRFIRAVLDFSFGLLCAAVWILAALHLRTQAMRGYLAAAAVLGFTVYMQTIGRIVRCLWVKFFGFVRKN